MIKDFPTDIGLIYEGERIRKQNMFVELGGPKALGAELLELSSEKRDRKSTRLNSSHIPLSRMPSSA